MSEGAAIARRFSWAVRIQLLASLAVLIFAVATIIRWTGPAVALSYSWEEGEVIRDRMTVAMSIRSQPDVLGKDIELEVASTEVTRVLDLDDAGNATLKMTHEDVEVVSSSLPGSETQVISELDQPIIVVVAPDGRILESSNPILGPEGIGDQAMTTTPILPDDAVSPGDTWEEDQFIDIGLGEGGFSMHMENELVRYDEVDGVETVVVESELSSPFDFSIDPAELAEEIGDGSPSQPSNELLEALRYRGDMDMTARSWVDPVTDEILRGVGEGTITISFGAGGPGGLLFGMEMDLEIETERLP